MTNRPSSLWGSRGKINLLLAAILSALLALMAQSCGTSGHSSTTPNEEVPGAKVSSARISHALAESQAYWNKFSKINVCKKGIRAFATPNPGTLRDSGMPKGDSAEVATCALYYDDTTYYTYSWPRLCEITLQMYGELIHFQGLTSALRSDNLPTEASECREPGDTQRYASPQDEPAQNCKLWVARNLPKLNIHSIQGCDHVMQVTAPASAITWLETTKCRGKDEVGTRDAKYLSRGSWKLRLLNPTQCNVIEMVVGAAVGEAEEGREYEAASGAEGPPENYYISPHLQIVHSN